MIQAAAVGQDQEAARREGVAVGGDEGGRAFGVRDEVQDRDQEQRDRPGEVEEVPGPGQDDGGVAEVGEDDPGGAGAGQQGVGVGVDHRVVVGVGHAGALGAVGSGLVHVRGRRDAGADVQELGDAFFPG